MFIEDVDYGVLIPAIKKEFGAKIFSQSELAEFLEDKIDSKDREEHSINVVTILTMMMELEEMEYQRVENHHTIHSRSFNFKTF